MLKFISYGKAVSILLIVFIHVFLAYYNANELWASVTNAARLDNNGYPNIIGFINEIVYAKLFGFLVAGSVCFFFLSTGFTLVQSKKDKSFYVFWKSRLSRLVLFYWSIVLLNLLISLFSSWYFDIDFKQTIVDVLWQFLLGVQYYIPKGVVLDLVVWFLAVIILFYFIASIVFKKFTLSEIILFDLVCLMLFFTKNLFGLEFIGNYAFLVKA
ncbi:acyltransferase family protein, partial [Ursidibacter sp. B-7004-1]